jgi:hypothetical protein
MDIAIRQEAGPRRLMDLAQARSAARQKPLQGS